MTSEEKSTWIVAAATALIFGWYTVKILVDAATTPISEIQYQDLLVVMVGVFVALIIVSHIVLAVLTRTIDGSDERDQKIDRFGEYIGGYVLGTGLLVVLGLAMAETEYFWIAHAALGVLVLAELTTATTKIIVYRKGF
ncbi:MAG: hypothetical protein OEM84_13160 [Acidimicrobiia bacterium]|nr:hypothetical protein [Acidimicrobiia bacterium]